MFWTLLGYTVKKFVLVHQTVSPCERVGSEDETMSDYHLVLSLVSKSDLAHGGSGTETTTQEQSSTWPVQDCSMIVFALCVVLAGLVASNCWKMNAWESRIKNEEVWQWWICVITAKFSTTYVVWVMTGFWTATVVFSSFRYLCHRKSIHENDFRASHTQRRRGHIQYHHHGLIHCQWGGVSKTKYWGL